MITNLVVIVPLKNKKAVTLQWLQLTGLDRAEKGRRILRLAFVYLLCRSLARFIAFLKASLSLFCGSTMPFSSHQYWYARS